MGIRRAGQLRYFLFFQSWKNEIVYIFYQVNLIKGSFLNRTGADIGYRE